MTEKPDTTETSDLPELPANRRTREVLGPDGRRYQVVAAKQGLPYRDVAAGFGAHDLNPLSWVLSWLISGLLNLTINGSLNWRAHGSASWKVGVIRASWFRERFVVKELLAPGVDPAQRMGELADAVALGLLG